MILKNTPLIIFLIGTIIMSLFMDRLGKTLKTTYTPNGILAIEFAKNSTEVNQVMNAWSVPITNGETNVDVAKKQTKWDYLYLIFYSGFLFLLNRYINSNNLNQNNWLKFGAMAGLFAGFFDIIENYHFMQNLDGPISDSNALITSLAAKTKFAFIAFSLFTAIYFGLKKYLIAIFQK
jgi:hypothetical protein